MHYGPWTKGDEAKGKDAGEAARKSTALGEAANRKANANNADWYDKRWVNGTWDIAQFAGVGAGTATAHGYLVPSLWAC